MTVSWKECVVSNEREGGGAGEEDKLNCQLRHSDLYEPAPILARGNIREASMISCQRPSLRGLTSCQSPTSQ
ncbi:hypothetical protein M404DRAFT_917842 [Pisolithus tinctorius Marx 270]|uniref:Uncharacterized protein n=1 Tax=Pisolithus tinctorius Marx 270 TaxID=870435 RepID=A0A0C3NPI2_PISTI|nr:hypothetical protein M404DRAFT_917842 [Pisolithus tinctorius Marx 270]